MVGTVDVVVVDADGLVVVVEEVEGDVVEGATVVVVAIVVEVFTEAVVVVETVDVGFDVAVAVVVVDAVVELLDVVVDSTVDVVPAPSPGLVVEADALGVVVVD